ncbi:hypothetical protein K438DRAFT_1975740 [Mycena galopus ATCC 62051]|nr:hypothetical protein K438DRAFT_1975740 [Mycena galopus ATCC 62051]
MLISQSVTLASQTQPPVSLNFIHTPHTFEVGCFNTGFVSSCLGFAQPPAFVADCKTLLNSVTAFTPTFTVLEDQVIFIIFNTCQLDFGVGPQTTGICGRKTKSELEFQASVGSTILSQCPNLAGGEASCNSGLYDIK